MPGAEQCIFHSEWTTCLLSLCFMTLISQARTVDRGFWDLCVEEWCECKQGIDKPDDAGIFKGPAF